MYNRDPRAAAFNYYSVPPPPPAHPHPLHPYAYFPQPQPQPWPQAQLPQPPPPPPPTPAQTLAARLARSSVPPFIHFAAKKAPHLAQQIEKHLHFDVTNPAFLDSCQFFLLYTSEDSLVTISESISAALAFVDKDPKHSALPLPDWETVLSIRPVLRRYFAIEYSCPEFASIGKHPDSRLIPSLLDYAISLGFKGRNTGWTITSLDFVKMEVFIVYRPARILNFEPKYLLDWREVKEMLNSDASLRFTGYPNRQTFVEMGEEVFNFLVSSLKKSTPSSAAPQDSLQDTELFIEDREGDLLTVEDKDVLEVSSIVFPSDRAFTARTGACFGFFGVGDVRNFAIPVTVFSSDSIMSQMNLELYSVLFGLQRSLVMHGKPLSIKSKSRTVSKNCLELIDTNVNDLKTSCYNTIGSKAKFELCVYFKRPEKFKIFVEEIQSLSSEFSKFVDQGSQILKALDPHKEMDKFVFLDFQKEHKPQ